MEMILMLSVGVDVYYCMHVLRQILPMHGPKDLLVVKISRFLFAGNSFLAAFYMPLFSYLVFLGCRNEFLLYFQ